MEIKGSHSLTQSPEAIWSQLNDPSVLARITPGLSRLENIEGDKFTAISEIKIGPVKARFEGELEMTNKVDGQSMVVEVRQTSKIGNVNAAISMSLDPENGETVINYAGEAKIVGKLATMGNRMVGSVVSKLSKQFFVNLENEFKNQ